MKNHPHPGLPIKLDCLEPLGLTVAEGARVLGVTRQTLCSGGGMDMTQSLPQSRFVRSADLERKGGRSRVAG